MSDDEVTLKIANVSLRVPICRDLATTKAIASVLEERMREIEAGSNRIDSTAFALRTAFEFASDLHLLRLEQEATVHEVAQSLAQLLDRLNTAADGLEADS